MIDSRIIQDEIKGASFSYFRGDEIRSLSVKQIFNSVAFDSLNRPIKNGLYDAALGVSPYDPLSKCQTCGLERNFCPGHLGHIELVAPIYNPFQFPNIYRLMKTKCFNCHSLRIPSNKEEYLILKLKLIKMGYIIEAAKLTNLFSSNKTEGTGDLQIIRSISEGDRSMSIDTESTTGGSSIANLDLASALQAPKLKHHKKSKPTLDLHNLSPNDIELDKQNIIKEYESLLANHKFSNNNKQETSSSISKALKDVISEFWRSIVGIKCPRCNSPVHMIKKEDYRKIFRMPLKEKDKAILRVKGMCLDPQIEFSDMEDLEDILKSESGESEEEVDSPQKLIPAPTKAGKQLLMPPLEVKEHLRKLWNTNTQLLSLIFGKVVPRENIYTNSDNYEIISQGADLLFLECILVPPNRFRPESKGGGEESFLHPHTVLLTKILNINIQLKNLLLGKSPPQSRGRGRGKRGGGNSDANNTNNATNTNTTITDEIEGEEIALVHNKLREVGTGGGNYSGNSGLIIEKWIELQDAINCFYDSTKSSKNMEKDINGIRQLLEKKEGMFRMKMMGKRVNYAARSVISPDPYLATYEIGIPQFMAKIITFPEHVAQFNSERLKQMIIKGANTYPGANMIEDNKGQRIILEHLGIEERKGLAYILETGSKVVYRHMMKGDILMVNRQPTLHKNSIMGHKARVLSKESTIRMHYANCKSYNADFDGDEINAHLVQTQQGRADGYYLMNTPNQYITPTSGKPLRGLIQDNVVAGVFLTCKNSFFALSEVNQLLYSSMETALSEGLIATIWKVPPAILKPVTLWTGKQVISSILHTLCRGAGGANIHNIHQGLFLESRSKVRGSLWGKIGHNEDHVIIRGNELLSGILDKNQFGDVEYGLAHAFYELYGPIMSAHLLSSLGKLFTFYLQMHGFTCSIDDLILQPSFEDLRVQLIQEVHKEGVKSAADCIGIENYSPEGSNYSSRVIIPRNTERENTRKYLPKNPFTKDIPDKAVLERIKEKLEETPNSISQESNISQKLDDRVKESLHKGSSEIVEECLVNGLYKQFPSNLMSVMTQSGAKGSNVNHSQITCLLGQQELEGKRVPLTPAGRSLPAFYPYDSNPRTGGFISDRFLSGLRPHDFFFHCMAGREGLIDTAVKTSRSGYLQRCLIKQLESLVVAYDYTVRDNDQNIIQMLYGEDGIDPIHTKYLSKMDFIKENFSALKPKYRLSNNIYMNSKEISEYRVNSRRITKEIKKARNEIRNIECGVSSLNLQGSAEYLEYARKVSQIAIPEDPLPVMNVFSPGKYFGAISEKQQHALKDYVKKNINKASGVQIKGQEYKNLYYVKYLSSLAQPGENVGIVAAQSIGEPSTQMTLNTFHLAGHGGANVTLGIPRLREILMTASTFIKTPLMTLPIYPHVTNKQLNQFANSLKKINLSEITKYVEVNQTIVLDKKTLTRIRQFEILIHLEDLKLINKAFDIKFVEIRNIFNQKFIPHLLNKLVKYNPKSSQIADIHISALKKGENVSGGNMMEDESQRLEEVKMMKYEREHSEHIGENEGYEGQKILTKKNLHVYEEDVDAAEEMKTSHITDIKNKYIENEEENAKLPKYLEKYCSLIRRVGDDEKNGKLELILGFPLEMKRILMIEYKMLLYTLYRTVDQILTSITARSVPGISNSFILERTYEGKKERIIQTEGINMSHIEWKAPNIVDLTRIETNDINYIIHKYGVETARNSIVREVKSVFDVYGINVDYRHLSLIADYMTNNGAYRPFNRIGMRENSSGFLKMSFETSVNYLTECCQIQDYDNLSTPSSAIVIGTLPFSGSAFCDILQDKHPPPSISH